MMGKVVVVGEVGGVVAEAKGCLRLVDLDFVYLE